jgi:hypothetical protein
MTRRLGPLLLALALLLLASAPAQVERPGRPL